jgi:hypothetical protein
MIKTTRKRKPRLRFVEIRVHPFKTWIQVAVGKDVYLTGNALAKKCGAQADFPPSPEGQACFITVPDDDNMWKFITAKPRVKVEELAHECFHAVVFLSSPEGRGDPITMASQECWAYTFENLLGNVLIAYKRLGGKIKK